MSLSPPASSCHLDATIQQLLQCWRKLLGAVSASEGDVPSLPLKKKAVAKKPPSSIPPDLRECLMRKQDDEDTDVPMDKPSAKASTSMLPVAALPGMPAMLLTLRLR